MRIEAWQWPRRVAVERYPQLGSAARSPRGQRVAD